MNRPGANIELERELSAQLTVHKNLGQEVVVTTVDKVKLCLIENRECLAAQKEWLMPLSLLVAFATTLVAAQFQDMGLKAAVWEAIYLIAAALSFVWLIRSVAKAWSTRAQGGIDHIVSRLKAESAGRD